MVRARQQGRGIRAARRAAGHSLSAGKKYLRACVYWFTAERMASHKSPQKLAMYESMLAASIAACACATSRSSSSPSRTRARRLPALFHRAPGNGRRPAMIHFDGFDVTKEWMHLCGNRAGVRGARHFATLMVDHPGIGAALRLQGLPMNPDSERWASAAMDWLEQPRRRRCAPGRRGRDEPGWLLRAARGGVREASCRVRGLGRALGECRVARSHPARSERGALGHELGRARALVLRRQDDRRSLRTRSRR